MRRDKTLKVCANHYSECLFSKLLGFGEGEGEFRGEEELGERLEGGRGWVPGAGSWSGIGLVGGWAKGEGEGINEVGADDENEHKSSAKRGNSETFTVTSNQAIVRNI